MNRRNRARAVLAAGQMIAARGEALVDELSRELPLSKPSIAFALERSLEKSASDAQLDEVVAWAGDEVDEVAVILSAGVFTAAVRAVALAWTVGRNVVVRASRQDRVFPRRLVDAIGDPAVRFVDELDVKTYNGNEIHIYGGDDTIREVRAAARPDVRVRSHGHGFGIALVVHDADDAIARSAHLLADDVVAFDQRGCLSPRVVFVVGAANAHSLATALEAALTERERALPRGQLSKEETAGATRYAESIAFAGELHRGAAHLVGVLAASPNALVLPPPGRHVHVVAVADVAAARNVVTPFARYVTAIGTDDRGAARGLDLPNARMSALGDMQRPPFDGPVDRRTT